jgi:molybdopterin/thiamine biosynthesis adenylyltransferase
MERSYTGKVDEDLHSRRLGIYGKEYLEKTLGTVVYVQGLGAAGIEVAKNSLLGGVMSLTINDDRKCQMKDLGLNPYVSEKDILAGKTLAEAVIESLRELNPHCKIRVHEGLLRKEDIGQFDVLCITNNYDQNYLVDINEATRASNKGFMWLGHFGLFGFLFLDFGPNFHQECKLPITSITKEGKVTVSQRHDLADGQEVTFRNFKGMTAINGKSFRIKVNREDRKSVDVGSLADYPSIETQNGHLTYLKRVPFRSLRETLENPYLPDQQGNYAIKQLDPHDDNEEAEDDAEEKEKFRPFQYHFILKEMLAFYGKTNRLPDLLCEEDYESCRIASEEKLRTKNWPRRTETRGGFHYTASGSLETRVHTFGLRGSWSGKLLGRHGR